MNEYESSEYEGHPHDPRTDNWDVAEDNDWLWEVRRLRAEITDWIHATGCANPEAADRLIASLKMTERMSNRPLTRFEQQYRDRRG